MFEVKQYPEFSWSFSRHSTFDQCKKQYGYNYYVSHNGWLAYNVDQLSQHAYRLKKLVSLPILFGQVMHDLVAKSIQTFFERDEQPSLDDLEARARQQLNQAFIDSTRHREQWQAKPSRFTMLYDCYYGQGLQSEEVQKYAALIRPTLEHFLNSETWRALTKARGRYQFEQIEDFTTVTIEGTKVFVVLDLLLYDRLEEQFLIVDWKTGKPSENDRTQLVLYALYVMAEKGVPLEQITACNEYLATGERTVFQPNQLEVDALIDLFYISVEQMKTYLTDEQENAPLPLEQFERNEALWKCSRCNFKELCQPPILQPGH